MESTISSKLFKIKKSFIFSYIEEIKNYTLKEDEKGYYLSKSTRVSAEEKIEAEERHSFKEKKVISKILETITLTIFFFLFFLTFSFLSFAHMEENMHKVAIIALIVAVLLDIAFYVISFTEKREDIKKDSLKISFVFAILFLEACMMTFYNTPQDPLFSVIFLFFAYGSFLEGIKKHTNIIFSEDARFWEYKGNNEKSTFLIVSLKEKKYDNN